jgi:hypothetical protein
VSVDLDRRTSLAMLATLLAGPAAALPGDTPAHEARRIPQKASRRVIIDNDFAGDPDGLVAAAHQLLQAKTQTVLITASALLPKLKVPGVDMAASATQGQALAQDMLRRMALPASPPVAAGSNRLGTLEPSAAAEAIVHEAMREHPLPLFFTCGGPLTNLAAALRIEPAIAQRMTVVWIGGGAYPEGGWEYNLATDLLAAREVIEGSRVPLWQVPQDAYRQVQMSMAELQADLRPISPFTRWLYSRFTQPPDFVDLGGTWPQGDNPLVLLTALSTESSRWRERPARRLRDDGSYGEELTERRVRVFEQLDVRLIVADLLAQLKLHAQR